MERSRPRSWQESLVRLFNKKKYQQIPLENKERFWALQDVSFEVHQGETFSIIGSNGAGKSTMLKLLTHIIRPTRGTIEINGRISALLELGAGFHPDLTGRENVYLNGAILGLPRRQIEHKLDEMVAFAELERFIDVPVRNYSSGMYVRLGFAVAVYTNPEILVVDEVLAVGDLVFQQKCMERIHKMKRDGVTIILVTHNLNDVVRLCERAIWLKDGQIEADGPATKVVEHYLAFSNEHYYQQHQIEQARIEQEEAESEAEAETEEITETPHVINRWGTFQAEITKIELLGANGLPPHYFKTGDFFRLRIHYKTHQRIETPTFGLAFYRQDDTHINGPNSVREGYDIPYIDGTGSMDYVIEQLPLNQGEYELTVAIYDRESTTAYDHHHRLYTLEVRAPSFWIEEGVVHIPAKWEHVS